MISTRGNQLYTDIQLHLLYFLFLYQLVYTISLKLQICQRDNTGNCDSVFSENSQTHHITNLAKL